jgi:putative phage-type endonuclease
MNFTDERRTGIGGSDIAAIMGENDYKSPVQVWREKVLGIIDEPKNPAILELGIFLEDFVARKYAEKEGLTLHQVFRRNKIFRLPRNPIILGHIDREIRLQGGNGVLECKALGRFTYRKMVSDGLPMMYYLQLQHYMLVTGYRWGAFAILNRDTGEFISFRVEAEALIAAAIENACRDFWGNYVIPKIEPPESNSKESGVASIPAFEGKIMRIESVELDRACADYAEAREIVNDAQGYNDLCKAKVIGLLGDNPAVETSSARIYYNTSKPRKIVDAARLKLEFPDVYHKVVKESEPTKTFRFYQLNYN